MALWVVTDGAAVEAPLAEDYASADAALRNELAHALLATGGNPAELIGLKLTAVPVWRDDDGYWHTPYDGPEDDPQGRTCVTVVVTEQLVREVMAERGMPLSPEADNVLRMAGRLWEVIPDWEWRYLEGSLVSLAEQLVRRGVGPDTPPAVRDRMVKELVTYGSILLNWAELVAQVTRRDSH